MHYVFERDGIRTYVPCTPATRSRAQRAYRRQEWVEFDPKTHGITLANPRKHHIMPVEAQYVRRDDADGEQLRALVAIVAVLLLMGIAGGIECGTIPFF